jgi:cytosine deaminase
VLGLPPAGTAPGDVADLLLVPDTDLGDVLAGADDARVVVSGGRVVADTRVGRSLDLPTGTVDGHLPTRQTPAPLSVVR